MSKLTLLAACLFPALLPGQEDRSPPAPAAENLFYRAYFFDRGERDAPRALRLYRRFLTAAPTHPRAGEAARFALNLLEQARRGAEAKAFAKKYAALLETSVKPGINATFLNPRLDVRRMQARFEGESREIFRYRKQIAKLIGLQPGQAVADVGAGTGLFTWIFARTVGKEGKVYAVEIAPRMIDHLKKLATAGRFDQVHVVHCTERSVELPAGSVDAVFICDTYHHFEFPKQTMASIHRALRPGGQVCVIDFHRIPGKSRPWILGHVRAGQETVVREIESVGFVYTGEEKPPLKENYFIRFVKK